MGTGTKTRQQNVDRYRNLTEDYFDGLGKEELVEELMAKVDDEIEQMDDEELAEQLRGLEDDNEGAPEGAPTAESGT